VAETHDKDRKRKQTKQTKQQASRSGVKSDKDSPSSSQLHENPDEKTHDT
jgi:hypothetical protein